MRRVRWTDATGRLRASLIPDDAPDSAADLGIDLGPPVLAKLGLSDDLERELHNQLLEREIYTAADAQRHLSHVVAAVRAVYKYDALKVLEALRDAESS